MEVLGGGGRRYGCKCGCVECVCVCMCAYSVVCLKRDWVSVAMDVCV